MLHSRVNTLQRVLAWEYGCGIRRQTLMLELDIGVGFHSLVARAPKGNQEFKLEQAVCLIEGLREKNKDPNQVYKFQLLTWAVISLTKLYPKN